MANNLKIYSNDGRETSYDIYADGVLTFEERLYQGLTNVMYPPEEEETEIEVIE